jgi:hypothetical protein
VNRLLRGSRAGLPVRGGLGVLRGQVWGAGDGIGPRRIWPGFRCLPALWRLFQGQGIPIARRRALSTAPAVRCLPAGVRVSPTKGGSLPGYGLASARRDLAGLEAMASWLRGCGFTLRVGQETGRRLQGAGEHVPFREGYARGPGPRPQQQGRDVGGRDGRFGGCDVQFFEDRGGGVSARGEGGSLAAVCAAVEVAVAEARWVQGGWELGLMCGLIARRRGRVVLVMARWLRRW